MKELIRSIEPLVSEELARANEKFPQFASAHEAWAVIKEEVEEAAAELISVDGELSGVWVFTKVNGIGNCKNHLMRMKGYAINLSAEAIQVAAMAQKELDLLERMEKESK